MEVGDNRQRARPTRGDGSATPQPILLKISDFILQKKKPFRKVLRLSPFSTRVLSKVAINPFENFFVFVFVTTTQNQNGSALYLKPENFLSSNFLTA